MDTGPALTPSRSPPEPRRSAVPSTPHHTPTNAQGASNSGTESDSSNTRDAVGNDNEPPVSDAVGNYDEPPVSPNQNTPRVARPARPSLYPSAMAPPAGQAGLRLPTTNNNSIVNAGFFPPANTNAASSSHAAAAVAQSARSPPTTMPNATSAAPNPVSPTPTPTAQSPKLTYQQAVEYVAQMTPRDGARKTSKWWTDDKGYKDTGGRTNAHPDRQCRNQGWESWDAFFGK